MIGRLTFTPRVEDGRPFYEFKGVGALEPILAGVLPPPCEAVVPPGEADQGHTVPFEGLVTAA